VLWSHNDSGGLPLLYAVDRNGGLLGTLRLEGVGNRDWEDLAVAPCGSGSCIWVAETGDNLERHETLYLYRVPELPPGDGVPVVPERFPMRLPSGPRDIEALFVLPGERPHFVTKGRNHPPAVYRYPLPLRRDSLVTLERVQELQPRPPSFRGRITGAAARPDGSLVAIRSYDGLHFYRVESDTLVELRGARVNLRPLEEPQGEAVAFGPGNEVILTSEAGPLAGRASMVLLECRVEPGPG